MSVRTWDDIQDLDYLHRLARSLWEESGKTLTFDEAMAQARGTVSTPAVSQEDQDSLLLRDKCDALVVRLQQLEQLLAQQEVALARKDELLSELAASSSNCSVSQWEIDEARNEYGRR